jgi:hypothetical protein
MIFLQTGPAETTGYMILGFAVIFGVLAIHLVSLRLRRRNFEQDLEVLKDLKK